MRADDLYGLHSTRPNRVPTMGSFTVAGTAAASGFTGDLLTATRSDDGLWGVRLCESFASLDALTANLIGAAGYTVEITSATAAPASTDPHFVFTIKDALTGSAADPAAGIVSFTGWMVNSSDLP